jgi:hypothetical protein
MGSTRTARRRRQQAAHQGHDDAEAGRDPEGYPITWFYAGEESAAGRVI